jgi:acyl-CoA thioester hydrolase
MSASAIAVYPLLILEKHLDTFGHVNNSTYLELYEEARWDIITRGGFGMEKIRETGLGPTILEVQLQFKRELKLRMPVVIRTQVQSYERKILKLKQWMELESGDIASEALFTVALFDVRARKLVDPTPEWKAALGI